MAEAMRLLALVVAALLLAVPAAAIARNPNTFNGMSLPMDNAYITMGADNDVAIFRTGNGSIEIDANATCTGNFAAANLTASNLIATDVLIANSINVNTVQLNVLSATTVQSSAINTLTLQASSVYTGGDLEAGSILTNSVTIHETVTATSVAAATYISAQNVTASSTMSTAVMNANTLGVSGTTTTSTLAVTNGATVGGTLNAGSVSAPSGTITAQTISADLSINSIIMRSYTGAGTLTVASATVVPLVFDTPLITSNIAVNTATVNAPNGVSCPPGSLFTFSRAGVYHFEAGGGWTSSPPGTDAQLGLYTSYEPDYAWATNDASVGGVWVQSTGDVYIPSGGVAFIYMYQSSGSVAYVSKSRRRVCFRLVHAVTL